MMQVLNFSPMDFFAEAEKHLPKETGSTVSFNLKGHIVKATRCADGNIEISGLNIKMHSPAIGAQARAVR